MAHRTSVCANWLNPPIAEEAGFGNCQDGTGQTFRGAFADQFAAEWLSLDKFDVVETDRKRHPKLTATVKRQLRHEPARFLEYLFRENFPRNLIQSDFVVINEVIAT